jgi:hypothetical protein
MQHQFNIQQLFALPHLYLTENKQQILPPYDIDKLVFTTEMEIVYSAERTGSLNKAVCASFFKV